MTDWYQIEATSPLFEGLGDVQVVFHGINKSGSKSMASVLRRALLHERRTDEDLSLYHMKGAPPLEQFRDMVDSRTGRSLVVGHYLYGSLRPKPRRIWVTQFRHPLPRMVSVYHWCKRNFMQRHGNDARYTSFPKFLFNNRGITHSQVAQLSRGYGIYSQSHAKMRLSGENLFELTIEALERDFTAIGIAERFEESIFTFAGLLGIKSVDPWQKDDRNRGRPPIDELTVAERDLVREIYHWDYRLYDWAVKKFKEQCSTISFGPSLQQYREACGTQYKDRLVGDTADDAVARWLTSKWRAGSIRDRA